LLCTFFGISYGDRCRGASDGRGCTTVCTDLVPFVSGTFPVVAVGRKDFGNKVVRTLGLVTFLEMV
jgi:hypothetical protein